MKIGTEKIYINFTNIPNQNGAQKVQSVVSVVLKSVLNIVESKYSYTKNVVAFDASRK